MGAFFTDRARRDLAANESLITTQRARAILRLTEQQWQRRKSQPRFPTLIRHGRQFLVQPHELLAYVDYENALHTGLSFTQVSLRVHRTIATLRALIAAQSFPEPIGAFGGHDRFAQADIERWELANRHATPLPPELNKPKRRVRKAAGG